MPTTPPPKHQHIYSLVIRIFWVPLRREFSNLFILSCCSSSGAAAASYCWSRLHIYLPLSLLISARPSHPLASRRNLLLDYTSPVRLEFTYTEYNDLVHRLNYVLSWDITITTRSHALLWTCGFPWFQSLGRFWMATICINTTVIRSNFQIKVTIFAN